MVHCFFLFFRFGYEMLLLIEIFCWIGLDLIRFCFGFLDSLSKEKKISQSSTTHLRLHSITASTMIWFRVMLLYSVRCQPPSLLFNGVFGRYAWFSWNFSPALLYIYVSLNFKLISLFSPTQVRNNFLFIYLLLLLQG